MSNQFCVTTGDLKEDYAVVAPLSVSTAVPVRKGRKGASKLSQELDEAFRQGVDALIRQAPQGANAIIHLTQTITESTRQGAVVSNLFSTMVIVTLTGTAVKRTQE